MRKTGEGLADFDGPENEARKAAILQYEVDKQLQGSEAEALVRVLATEQPSRPIAINEVTSLGESVAAINAMEGCATRGCKLVRVIFLLNICDME